MSRNKVIAYSDASGNCRVVIPTMDCPLSDDAVIAKDIPTSDYSLIEPSSLPSNLFRDAWKYDHNLKSVGVDLTIAKTKTTEILEARKQDVPQFKAKVKTGYLARYTALVTSANTGGVMQVPENLI